MLETKQIITEVEKSHVIVDTAVTPDEVEQAKKKLDEIFRGSLELDGGETIERKYLL